MKKLLLLLMMLAMAVPLWASEHTVTINRNEGLYQDGTGAYYCVKDGIMMTFTSGLDNENYLVEHQQMYFEVNSYNYFIKRIVFHCVDSTTSAQVMGCFYWGPTTLSIVQNFYDQSQPGTLTVTDPYTAVWEGHSNHMQFNTMAKPVRFGSVDIVYDKLDGDIFDLVTNINQIQEGKTYIAVTQNNDKVMKIKLNQESTILATDIVEWMGPVGSEKTRVKVDGNALLFRMESVKDSLNGTRKGAILNTLNGYIRESTSSGSLKSLILSTGITGYNSGVMYLGNAYNWLCWFREGTSNGSNSIRYDSSIGSKGGFKIMSNSDASIRVWLYKLAEAYNITTVCDPSSGGSITLGNGAVNSTSQQGEIVNFTVDPAAGYSLNELEVTIDGTSTTVQVTDNGDGTYCFVMPAQDVTITAHFEIAGAYQIFTENNPVGGGVVNVTGQVTSVDGNYYANDGNNVTVIPSPNWGWESTGLTVTDINNNAVQVTDNGDGSYSFVMPNEDVTATATYRRVIGDIFDLVTLNSQIQTGQTYIIVSQNYDKVMRYWTPDQTTFTSTPIVNWPLGAGDFTKVRVNDNAVFFRMDNVADSTTTGGLNLTKAAYLNTLNGYMRTQNYNVFLSSPLARENRGSMMISANAYNYLLKFMYDNTSGSNTDYVVRYNNANGDFNVLNWTNQTDNANTLTRVWLYKLAESYPITLVCTPPAGGSINLTGGVLDNNMAQDGETVTFSVTTNNGYILSGVTVTYTDGTTGTIELNNNGNGTYSFIMPSDAVTITANFESDAILYNITTESIPAAGGYFHVYVNNVNYGASADAHAGENVAVWVGTNPGYRIASVTAENLTTGEAVTLTLDPNNSNDAGNTYDFTMPVGNVHITAKFYTPLFLLGTAMGRTNWCPSGPEFAFDAENDQYYLDVYFKGIRNVPGQNDDEYGYFSMAGAVAPVDWTNYGETYSDRWGEVQQRLAAETDHNLVGDGSTDVVLYNDRPDNAFKIKAGVYRIIVNHDKNRMSIVQYKPSIAFDPVSGSPVNMNDVVDITSNLQDTVHHIAARYGINEVAQKFRNTTDGGANWTSDENSGQNGAQAVITHTGTTTVVAEAWIGYITARDTAEYVLRGITYVVNPDGNAGTITGPTSSTPGTTVTVTPTAASGYYLDNVTVTYTVDGVDQSVTVTDNGDGTYSFVMPDVDVTVTANFASGYRIFAECLPPEGGSISVASAAQAGETVTFSVSENAGYVLTNLALYDDVSGQYIYPDYNAANNTYSFTMPSANVYIDAFFGEGYTITTVVDPAQGGVLNVTPAANTYGMNAPISVELIPATDYEVVCVTLTNNTTHQVIELYPDPTALDNGEYHYFFRMPASNVTVTAYLAIPTPLGYIERYDTKEDGDHVVVADELIGTWMAKQYVWAKDQQQSNYYLNKTGDPIDFIRTKMKREASENGLLIDWQTEEWDQSNWVMLDFGQISDFADWETNPATYQAMREAMQNYIDNTITEGTIKGIYQCLGSPIDVPKDNFVGMKCQHVIVLDQLPGYGTLATSESESLGYPGYVGDPREWYHYSNPTRYMYNHYMSSNFNRSNTTSSGVAISSDVLDDYADMGYPLNPNDRYFFMTPKDQEVAQVWGVWVGSRSFQFNGETITGDVFESYQYNLQENVNSLGFTGSFFVPNWQFNRLDLPGGSVLNYGKPGEDDEKEPLDVNQSYIFHAAIQYSFQAGGTSSGAPQYTPTAPSSSSPGFYMVYPLDLMSSDGAATSVREIRSQMSTEIDSIRYYNIMGQESETPFDGINIEVIRYKDGSSISHKILR